MLWWSKQQQPHYSVSGIEECKKKNCGMNNEQLYFSAHKKREKI